MVALLEDDNVCSLSRLGFGPFFEQQLPPSGGDGTIPARIADAVLVDGKNLQEGPPPSYEKIRIAISKRVR